MGRKERSNIVRIEKAVKAKKRKYSHKLKDYSRESIRRDGNYDYRTPSNGSNRIRV